MKHTNCYDQNDLAAYKCILKDTNTHKHYCLPSSTINTNESSKYKDIIVTLFPPPSRTHSGRGYNVYMGPKTIFDYVYWNDPNELLELLRLLLDSQRLGYTEHNNEIVCIVDSCEKSISFISIKLRKVHVIRQKKIDSGQFSKTPECCEGDERDLTKSV